MLHYKDTSSVPLQAGNTSLLCKLPPDVAAGCHNGGYSAVLFVNCPTFLRRRGQPSFSLNRSRSPLPLVDYQLIWCVSSLVAMAYIWLSLSSPCCLLLFLIARKCAESSAMSLSKLGLASRRAFHAAAPRAARILCLDNIDPVSVSCLLFVVCFSPTNVSVVCPTGPFPPSTTTS